VIVFNPAEVIEAVKATMEGPFPLPEDEETAVLLNGAIHPALQDLPDHLRCEVVALALQTMFVMGLAAGAHLGRGE
jgi:hypothetical protein